LRFWRFLPSELLKCYYSVECSFSGFKTLSKKETEEATLVEMFMHRSNKQICLKTILFQRFEVQRLEPIQNDIDAYTKPLTEFEKNFEFSDFWGADYLL
jgi:hypothetical protein